LTENTFVGEIDLPFVANVSTTNVVAGNSPDVVINIYRRVTGANLAAIVSATGIATEGATSIESLADYLNFEKVIPGEELTVLKSRGINSFARLAEFIQSKIGTGTFTKWADVSTLLNKVDNPADGYSAPATTSGNTRVISDTAISNILNQTGTGSGVFGNPVLKDYFGCVMGFPHKEYVNTISSAYNNILTTAVSTAVINLDRAVIDYITAGTVWLANIANTAPSLSGVTSNVTALNSALNGVSIDSTQYRQSEQAYYQSLTALTNEVNALDRAGVVFGTSSLRVLDFGLSLGRLAGDKTEVETYQFISNLITADIYGDTVRSAIAEGTNQNKLGGAGIILDNDANPRAKIFQSQQQNISLSTYLSQNK
jgi:hypothetical protein